MAIRAATELPAVLLTQVHGVSPPLGCTFKVVLIRMMFMDD